MTDKLPDMGRPTIRRRLWERVIARADEEEMDPSEIVEDALEHYLQNYEGREIGEGSNVVEEKCA